MSPTGSTPNLLAATGGGSGGGFGASPQHWSSTTQLPSTHHQALHHSQFAGGGGSGSHAGLGMGDNRGYNTIAHPGHWGHPQTQLYSPAQPLYPSNAPEGSYAAHQPANPPLGYIVAYTPEQVEQLVKDQYSVPSSTHNAAGASHYQLAGPFSTFSPTASPKRPVSMMSHLVSDTCCHKNMHENTSVLALSDLTECKHNNYLYL